MPTTKEQLRDGEEMGISPTTADLFVEISSDVTTELEVCAFDQIYKQRHQFTPKADTAFIVTMSVALTKTTYKRLSLY